MPLKIFIIDDEESIRTTLKWHLEDLGHEVITAAQPLDCDILRGHHCNQDQACCNVLIIDYHMPGMTGLEFIEMLIRCGCRGCTANVLIISGYIGAIDLTKVQEFGCSVMQKPVSFAELEEWLKRVEKPVKINPSLRKKA